MSASARRSRWFVTGLLAIISLAVANPAAASCELPQPIDKSIAEAETVFVGTVTALMHQDRVARFDVEDVWKGDVGPLAVVSGGPSISEIEAAAREGLELGTSVDRTYVMGVRYLVVSHGSDADSLYDNACSQTQQYTAALDVLRPDTAYVPDEPPAPPTPTTNGGTSAWLWGGLAVAAGAVIGITALSLHGRRHHHPAM